MKRLRTTWMPVLILSLIGIGAAQAQPPTTFEQDVNDAIDDGLDYMRNNNHFTSNTRANGLDLLALLEKRPNPNFDSGIVGYDRSAGVGSDISAPGCLHTHR